MRITRLVVIALMESTFVVQADTTDIEYLLEAVAGSECEFWRNGKKHSAEKASRHLRMKYNRTKKHVKTAEDFINGKQTDGKEGDQFDDRLKCDCNNKSLAFLVFTGARSPKHNRKRNHDEAEENAQGVFRLVRCEDFNRGCDDLNL